MTPVLVDSNVILDVATGHPIWSAWSDQALARLADETILVVNPLIYAQVSVRYETVEEWAFPCHPAARPRGPWHGRVRRASADMDAAFKPWHDSGGMLPGGSGRRRPSPPARHAG